MCESRITQQQQVGHHVICTVVEKKKTPERKPDKFGWTWTMRRNSRIRVPGGYLH